MIFDNYKVQIPYPTKPKAPVRPPVDAPPDTFRVYADDLEQYNRAMEHYKDAQIQYRMEEAKMEDKFKADALAEVGLSEVAGAEKVFIMAWGMGHASGYSEVLNHLYDLAYMVREVLTANGIRVD
jgi:hypothetical protein